MVVGCQLSYCFILFVLLECLLFVAENRQNMLVRYLDPLFIFDKKLNQFNFGKSLPVIKILLTVQHLAVNLLHMSIQLNESTIWGLPLRTAIIIFFKNHILIQQIVTPLGFSMIIL